MSPNPKDQLLGNSDAMQKIRATINKIARSQAPVHISGPSGSGKELAARQIHHKSTRQSGAFAVSDTHLTLPTIYSV